MLKKILILGASGFIGKAVARELAESFDIRAFARKKTPDFDAYENIEPVTGDFAAVQAFDEILQDVDTVVHLICTTVPGDDTKRIPAEIQENVIPTVRLLESMVHRKVKNIIFVSSAGAVYGETGDLINSVSAPLNPRCGYGVQKCVIEKYLLFYALRYGLNIKIMRVTNPYGWGQDTNKMQGLIPIFINRLLKGEEISIYGDGSHERDYLFIEDLVQAVRRVIEYSGNEHIFNIGYGHYYSINQIVEYIEKIAGRKFKRINYVKSRFCDVHKSYVDIGHAQKILNWKPVISLETGIELTVSRLT